MKMRVPRRNAFFSQGLPPEVPTVLVGVFPRVLALGSRLSPRSWGHSHCRADLPRALSRLQQAAQELCSRLSYERLASFSRLPCSLRALDDGGSLSVRVLLCLCSSSVTPGHCCVSLRVTGLGLLAPVLRFSWSKETGWGQSLQTPRTKEGAGRFIQKEEKEPLMQGRKNTRT